MADNESEEKALLQLIASNDRLYLPGDDRPHGFLVPDVVEKITWTSDFSIMHERPRRVDVLDASDGEDMPGACNAAFAKVVKACQDNDLFNLKGEGYEEFAIMGLNYPARLFRYAAPLFGIISQGAHLTAYTRTQTSLKIWVPRRSPTISTYPNKLDSTVAGGISAENTTFETIIKEAYEAASLPEHLTRGHIRSVGALTYINLLKQGQGEVVDLVKPDMISVYDLELAEDVVPKPYDGEVKEFYLMTLGEVKSALLQQESMPNSTAVMIDFFIRNGFVKADTERGFSEMNMRVHRTLPFPTAPRL